MDQQLKASEINTTWANEKLKIWLELFVVTLIGVLPDLYRALTVIVYPQFKAIETPSSYYISFLIVRSITVTLPILYIIWRNNGSLSNFGMKKFIIPNDIAMGIGIFILSSVLLSISGIVTSTFFAGQVSEVSENIQASFHMPESFIGISALFLGCVLNGLAEEIVMRGYFIERLEYLLGSATNAIIFSSIMFASYHIYQGGIGAFHVFIFGVIYGIIYCKYRKIWPLAIAHSLHNIVIFGFMRS